MHEYQEKRKIKKIFFSLPAIVLIVAFFVILIMSTLNAYNKSREAVELNNKAKQELEALRMKKQELEANITRLNSEAGIEEEIRKKFQVGKHGEEELIILDDGSDDFEEFKKGKISSFFSNIWKWFKDLYQ